MINTFKDIEELEKWKDSVIKEYGYSINKLRVLTGKLRHYTEIKSYKGKKHFPSGLTFNDIIGICAEEKFALSDKKKFNRNFYKVFRRKKLLKYRLSKEEKDFLFSLAYSTIDSPLLKIYRKIISASPLWKNSTEIQIKKAEEYASSVEGEKRKLALEAINKLKLEMDILEDFSIPGMIDAVDNSRRKALFLIGGGIIGGILLSTGLVSVMKLIQSSEKILKSDITIQDTGNQKYVTPSGIKKVFKVPFFFKGGALRNAALMMPVAHYESLINQKIRDKNKMYDPSRYMEAFTNTLFDLDEQKRTYEAEKYAWGRWANEETCSVIFCLRFINSNIEYCPDPGVYSDGTPRKRKTYYNKAEYYKFPEQTLLDGYGDCEDYSYLLLSLLTTIKKKYRVSIDFGETELFMPGSGHSVIYLHVNKEFIKVFCRGFLLSILKSLGKSNLSTKVYSAKDLGRKIEFSSVPDSAKFLLLMEPQVKDWNAWTKEFGNYNVRHMISKGNVISLKKFKTYYLEFDGNFILSESKSSW